MMITKEKLKQAVVQYVNKEIVGKASGLMKWAVAIGINGYVSKIDAVLPMLVSLGVAQEDGMIDIDRFYDIAIDAVDKTGSVVQNIFGTDITFSKSDVETIFRFCRDGNGYGL